MELQDLSHILIWLPGIVVPLATYFLHSEIHSVESPEYENSSGNLLNGFFRNTVH